MITIPASNEWIDVESAFGGFAIYRRNWFDIVKYVGVTEDGDEVCEHVSINLTMRKAGAKIFINPQLINAGLTPHTRHLKFPRTLVRGFRSILDNGLGISIGRRKGSGDQTKDQRSKALRRRNATFGRHGHVFETGETFSVQYEMKINRK